MYQISVSFGTGAQMWGFMFKSEEKAKAAYKEFWIPLNPTPFVEITDDFSQTGCFAKDQIVAVLIENLDESSNANIERQLIGMRAGIRGEKVIESDPQLKAHNLLRGRGNGGMPFFQPGPMPRA